MKKRALLSVSDKTGIVKLAKALHEHGVELISTGGTEQRIKDSGIPVKNISDVTGFPECLDGRVKTLHPKVHAGILAIRNSSDHMSQLEKLDIETIDYVIINLYPFKETVTKPNVSFEDAIENIDIGGPTMLRSAAKNHHDVVVVVDPADYDAVIESVKAGEVSSELKFDLALKVFEHTAKYDALIAEYLRKVSGKSPITNDFTVTYEKVQSLRYGENPHQNAAFYKETFDTVGTLAEAKQLQGKELSFNNINDTHGALILVQEFEKPACVAVKHSVPCGVGTGINAEDAYQKAYNCDPQSIYGGIVAFNTTVDADTARKMKDVFLEVLIAPSFEADALEVLASKKNLRVLELPSLTHKVHATRLDLKKVAGGLLVQEADQVLLEGELKTVTDRMPSKKEIEEMLFAWKVCKHVKSNGIVLTKDGMTIGIGQGQVSRVWAAENAVKQSNVSTKGSILASDAYLPFADNIAAAAKAGVTAIIQPGGSIRDEEVIEAANQHGIAMVFTGIRHFRH